MTAGTWLALVMLAVIVVAVIIIMTSPPVGPDDMDQDF
jgi:hypothetical protein